LLPIGVTLSALSQINAKMRNLEKAFSMEKVVSNSDWNSIATAPDGVELELCVFDSEEYHR
jgi:hypothetical protein